MRSIANRIQNFVAERFGADEKADKGATAVEYGLLVGLIAVVIIVTVTALGGQLDGLFGTVSEALPTVAPETP